MSGAHFTGPLTNTRHIQGVRASRSGAPHSVSEADFATFFDEFYAYVAAGTSALSPWTEIKDTSAVALVLADAPNGVLNMSGTAGDNTGASIQLSEEGFIFSSGREGWFEARIMAEDADQQDIYLGFTVAFATNPEAVLTAADRIGFQVNDGDASIICKTERSGTETSTDSGVDLIDYTTATDPADAAWTKLAVHVSRTDDAGGGFVEFFVNDNLVVTHTTNVPDDVALSVAAFTLNGEAVQNSLLVDYIYASGSR